MSRSCPVCGSPVSRWSEGGRCRSCERAERGKREAVEKYPGDMALLSFLREGGSQEEAGMAWGMTRAGISAWAKRARVRVEVAREEMERTATDREMEDRYDGDRTQQGVV